MISAEVQNARAAVVFQMMYVRVKFPVTIIREPRLYVWELGVEIGVGERIILIRVLRNYVVMA